MSQPSGGGERQTCWPCLAALQREFWTLSENPAVTLSALGLYDSLTRCFPFPCNVFKTSPRSKHSPGRSGSSIFPAPASAGRWVDRLFLASGRDPIRSPFLERRKARISLGRYLREVRRAARRRGRGAHASGAAGCASGARARPSRSARHSRGLGLVLSRVRGALSPRGGTRALGSVRHCGAFSQFSFK